METVNLLGLTFDDLDVGEAVQILRGRPRAARFSYVVTPNADHIARLRRQPRLAQLYESALLCLLDSRAIHQAATWLGVPVPPVATGADLAAELLVALEPQTVAIIGMREAEVAALRARYPDLQFAHHAPPKNLLQDRLAFRRARDFAVRANARFTFIALGSPLQELLAYAIALQPHSTGTGLCIGSALEYCAGTAVRAPGWMRSHGLEWAYRLAREPVRLAGRYLVQDPPVFWELMAAFFSQRARQSPPDEPSRSMPAAISARGPYQPPRPLRLQKIQDAG
jgi:exopolysaccharide biosynthesis WecB/TagA/CpsF family protein